jgi:ribosomal protein S18 acetylase RimI-like enzyme
VQVRSLGYRTDLMLRRLAGASVADRGDHLVVRTPSNPTFYWGNFLLLASPPADGEGSRWLDVFATEFPDAPHVAIGIDGVGGVDAAACGVRELLAAGLELETNVVLTAEELRPPPAARSGSVDVRPLRRDADWAQAVEVRLATYEAGGTEHKEFVERKFAEARQLVSSGHGSYVGAVVDGVVRASLGVFTDGSGVARYQNVETHPDFRRRGLASALLVEASRFAVDELGARRLVIVAEPGYVAVDLYRALGFEDAEQQVQLQRTPR